MSEITFKKRRFGNLSLYTLAILFLTPMGIMLLYKGILGVITGLFCLFFASVFLFGKEMVNINFETGNYKIYTQILVLKFGERKKIPELKYLLVRNFKARDYDNLYDEKAYFEVAMVTQKRNKIVLAQYQGKKKTLKLVAELSKVSDIRIVDSTKRQILSEYFNKQGLKSNI